MNSAGNPLATLLLTAPLLVVPTLAALGLPDSGGPADAGLGFTLGGESPGEVPGADVLTGLGDETDELGDADPFGAMAEGSETAAGGDGLFADSARELESPADLESADDDFGSFAVAPTGGPPPNQPTALASAFPAAAVEVKTADAVETQNTLTETAARTGPPAVGPADLPILSARLKEMGATRLTLEPAGGAFYFGCTLAERTGGATIARRFEAEAPTAAAAVADVLKQVRAYRSAAGNPAADVALADPAR